MDPDEKAEGALSLHLGHTRYMERIKGTCSLHHMASVHSEGEDQQSNPVTDKHIVLTERKYDIISVFKSHSVK
jgi:hypothetical protein